METKKFDNRKRTSKVNIDDMVFGKIPPQNKEIEEAVLGACLLERGAFEIASEILEYSSFYVEAHQHVFSAMHQLAVAGLPIDLLTVVEQLKKMDKLDMAGGAYAVTKLTNSVVSGANVETHSLIIRQKFIIREIIRVSGETISDAYEDSTDVFKLLDRVGADIMAIDSKKVSQYDNLKEAVVDVMMDIDTIRQSGKELTGITSGFSGIDNITGGWKPGQLIILAARPGVGKSCLALNFAREAIRSTEHGCNVGLFSLEMPKNELIQRLLSSESGIGLEKITRGKLTDSEYTELTKKGMTPLQDYRSLYIDDSGELNIMQLRAKCRRMKAKHKVGMIIIDYLQLMSGLGDKKENREQEISKISRECKKTAKELGVPIIALSQLSRELEGRKGGVPILKDLRESGAIEQDADMVAFLYHPESDGKEEINEVKFKIAKFRNGVKGTITLQSDLSIQKFYTIGTKPDEPLKENKKKEPAPGEPRGTWKPVEGALFIQKGSKMANDDIGNEPPTDDEDEERDFN